jgi:hypothetical protein
VKIHILKTPFCGTNLKVLTASDVLPSFFDTSISNHRGLKEYGMPTRPDNELHDTFARINKPLHSYDQITGKSGLDIHERDGKSLLKLQSINTVALCSDRKSVV